MLLFSFSFDKNTKKFISQATFYAKCLAFQNTVVLLQCKIVFLGGSPDVFIAGVFLCRFDSFIRFGNVYPRVRAVMAVIAFDCKGFCFGLPMFFSRNKFSVTFPSVRCKKK